MGIQTEEHERTAAKEAVAQITSIRNDLQDAINMKVSGTGLWEAMHELSFLTSQYWARLERELQERKAEAAKAAKERRAKAKAKTAAKAKAKPAAKRGRPRKAK